MTAEVLELRRRGRGFPVRIEIDQERLVGRLMDHQVAVEQALTENGAAMQYARQAALDPYNHGAFDAARLLRAQRVALTDLLAGLRADCGEYDGRGGSAA